MLERRAALWGVAFLIGGLGPALAAEPSSDRKAELERLLVHDCGSCHGMTLKGGLGLPLLPAALELLPEEVVVQAILEGRPGTAMPGWRPFLDETEARWLARRLKDGAS